MHSEPYIIDRGKAFAFEARCEFGSIFFFYTQKVKGNRQHTTLTGQLRLENVHPFIAWLDEVRLAALPPVTEPIPEKEEVDYDYPTPPLDLR